MAQQTALNFAYVDDLIDGLNAVDEYAGDDVNGPVNLGPGEFHDSRIGRAGACAKTTIRGRRYCKNLSRRTHHASGSLISALGQALRLGAGGSVLAEGLGGTMRNFHAQRVGGLTIIPSFQ